MNAAAVAQVFFDRRHAMPAGLGAPDESAAPDRGKASGRSVDAVAGYLVALFEAFCAAELRPFLDADAEALVATQIDWLQRAPVAAGATLRLSGWVEAAGTRTVTFHVQAHDAQEEVCEGRLRFDVGERDRAERAIARKHAAAQRRQLFWTA
jgi:predicted thioesterase